jgi:tetratricopeptide (TPR) repeat protein
MAVLLAAAVLVAYVPALDGSFLWDDDAHVTRPELRSVHGLWRIWFELGATQQYYPLLHSAFWLEHRLWGNAAAGYHLVNVLLHATSACLLLLILRRLEVPGAPLAAAIFARNPGCYLCLNTLGMVEYESGRLAEAIERYERALSIKPNSAEAHNNLGNALVKTGRVSDAIGHYEQALRTAPNYVLAYNNLGGALLFLGRLSEAREQYEAALRIMPDYEPARRNLSILETLQEGAAVSPSLDLATGSGRASPGRRPSPR